MSKQNEKPKPKKQSKKKSKKKPAKKQTHKQLYGWTPISTPDKMTRLEAYAPLTMNGWSYYRVAKFLGYNVNTVKTDFKNARDNMRKSLEAEDLAPRKHDLASIVDRVLLAPKDSPNGDGAESFELDWDHTMDKTGLLIMELVRHAARTGKPDKALQAIDRFIKAYGAKYGATRINLLMDQREQNITVIIEEREDQLLNGFVRATIDLIPEERRDKWIQQVNAQVNHD